MGEEYPATLVDGELTKTGYKHGQVHPEQQQTYGVALLYLTAPKRAPSHSFFKVSTVLSGRAVLVRLKVSNPASRSTKENFNPNEAGRASSNRRPAYTHVNCQFIDQSVGFVKLRGEPIQYLRE